MKTAVSIPDELFAEAEIAARELGLSRSKLVQTALEDFLKARQENKLRERIDRELAQRTPEQVRADDEEDEIWLAHSSAQLRDVEWKA